MLLQGEQNTFSVFVWREFFFHFFPILSNFLSSIIYFFSILYVIFFVVIVFPIEPFQNNFAYAQDNMQKCFEFAIKKWFGMDL